MAMAEFVPEGRMKIGALLLASLICVIVSTGSGYADPLLKSQVYFSDGEKEKLAAGTIMTRSYLKGVGMVNSGSWKGKIKIPPIPKFKWNLNSYEMIVEEKAFMPCRLDGSGFLALYNGLGAFSRLTGMQYYSVSDRKLLPFILKCHRIVSPQSPRKVSDVRFSKIPERTTAYFILEDNRLGEMTFRNTMYSDGKNFLAINSCINPIKKFLLTINEAYEYHQITIMMYDHSRKGFFYYGVQAMRVRSGIVERFSILKPDSFGNRMRALTVRTAGILGLTWKYRLKAFQ